MDIQGLKDKILQLAIQGKLVEQYESDEPASVLLKRIKEERGKLVKEGKIKKQKLLPEITQKEKSFEIPKGWEWVRLGTVINSIYGGGTPDKSNPMFWDGNIKWASVKDFGDSDMYLDGTIDSITEEGLDKSSSKIVKRGDFIISTRMGLGRIVISNIDVAINQDLKGIILSSFFAKKLFYHFYKSLEIKGTGTTVKGIKQEELLNILIPFPPLAEQKRIVEKVDQLFTLVDELDSNKGDLLGAINLTRNQVLQEAIQGKLVGKNPEDEPASILLAKIKKEKEKLIKEKKIRKEKPLAEITEEEKPFEIPEGWEWVRLGDVGLINMGQSPKGDTVNHIEGMEFHQGKVCFGDKYLKKSDKYTTDPKKISQPGDIILSVRAPVGTVNITEREVCIGRGLCAISSIGGIIEGYYYYAILAFEEHLIKKATGTTFLAVKASTVNEMIIPLPPLAEQKRIVEKVDTVMAMLDELETELNNKV